ncbi:MAG: hypothetical protein ACRDTF_07085 [Pseudonocardiaceae bacterium]
MTRKRGAPQGGVPGRRRTGRDRRRQDVYLYVEGGTERDYLRYLKSRFGDNLGFHFIIHIRTEGMTPTQLLDAAEVKAHELADEQLRMARVRGSTPPASDNTRTVDHRLGTTRFSAGSCSSRGRSSRRPQAA